MNTCAFVDTGALVAIAGPRDQYHARAHDIARRHLARGGTWVGTTLVLGELHGLLVKRAGPEPARHILSALLDDPAYEWRDASTDLVRAATDAWLEPYRDQHFTLTDAVGFEVMRSEGLDQAFTFDNHFVTAGYTLLG